MIGLLCLLIALLDSKIAGNPVFWLAGCVALSILAIDEAIGGHEWVERNQGLNDDYPKAVLWILTAFVLHKIYRKVRPDLRLKYVFAVGYAFHTFYLLFEISDGEFYDVSDALQPTQAKWGEEICELIFLSAYWLGFVFFYQSVTQSIADRGGAGQPG